MNVPSGEGPFPAVVLNHGYFDSAVMIHHGTADDVCPFVWSEETRDALVEAGVETTFHAYDGEGHTFSFGWELSMQRTTAFLRDQLNI